MDPISLTITNKRKTMEKKESFPITKFLSSLGRGIKIGFLLIIISIQLSAKNFAQQKISLNSERSDIHTVFKMIEKQSSYRFFYSNDVLPANKEVTAQFKDAYVEVILNKILDGLPVTWKLIDDFFIQFNGWPLKFPVLLNIRTKHLIHSFVHIHFHKIKYCNIGFF